MTIADAPPKSDVLRRREWLATCGDTGTIISVTVSDEPRPRWARVLVFLTWGPTLWYEAEAENGRLPGLTLKRTEVDGGETLLLSVRCAFHEGTIEVADPSEADFTWPVTIALDLQPYSMLVRLDEPATGTKATATGTGYRMSGSLATGAVIQSLDGMAWISSSASAIPGENRIQAMFQDGSSFVASNVPEGNPADRAAAFVKDCRASSLPVWALSVEGRDRRQPVRLTCGAGAHRPLELAGQVRNEKQHVAFLRPDGRGTWQRVAYTPFEFVRSGITGFGLLEQTTTVDTPQTPVDPPGPEEPFDH